ncbi:hypothetical protein CTV96_12010 [Bacillus altitudinis]|nr:hypothetical protein CTV96_12010 [Bacillus altitudinis]PKQ84947.1 hypothetical protein CTV98_010545 [Bacillus altitudinis]
MLIHQSPLLVLRQSNAEWQSSSDFFLLLLMVSKYLLLSYSMITRFLDLHFHLFLELQMVTLTNTNVCSLIISQKRVHHTLKEKACFNQLIKIRFLYIDYLFQYG